jgi:hypothetical protein
MAGSILLSTAYLPPIEYMALISRSEKVLIERQENYIKQTFRNRCNILTSSGSMALTVPVYLGSFHKTPIKDIRIDYSRRWQQVHTGAIRAAYAAAPFYIFYSEEIERIILRKHDFLLDLNMELLQALLKMLKMKPEVGYTTEFQPVNKLTTDPRYSITPKRESLYEPKRYQQVFPSDGIAKAGLSIIDMLFNTGPESAQYF